jgi:hypothetical protein
LSDRIDEFLLVQRLLQDFLQFVYKVRAGEVGNGNTVGDVVRFKFACRDERRTRRGSRDDSVGELEEEGISYVTKTALTTITHKESSTGTDTRVTASSLIPFDSFESLIVVHSARDTGEESASLREYLLI